MHDDVVVVVFMLAFANSSCQGFSLEAPPGLMVEALLAGAVCDAPPEQFLIGVQ